jgi:hypothetical protein
MRKVFEEGILAIGHTHEDIDGCFGYLSKVERKKQIHFGKFDKGFCSVA